MGNDTRAAMVIVGGGPRGVSLLERVCAAIREDDGSTPLTIHLVDDVEVGAGRIWRTDQTRELCMNTLAHAVTLFTDESVTMVGPVRPGPTLYEWALLAYDAQGGVGREDDVAAVPALRREAFAAASARAGLAAGYGQEIRGLRPESHPSRALYGEYISWCLAHAVATRPPHVTVTTHLARATDVETRDGRQVVTLDDGRLLVADAVILATGWLPRAATDDETAMAEAIARHPDLVWVRPGNPVDQDLDRVPDGAVAIVRGLGMGFFDAMALLTIGRGGRFEPDAAAAGGLRYAASGREPVLHVTSHRGLPYRSKSLYGSLPPRARLRHLRSVDWPSVPRPLDFDAAIWPLIVKDAFAEYYEALHGTRPGALAGPIADLLAAIDVTPGDPALLAAAVAPFVPDARDRFDFLGATDPVDGSFDSPDTFTAFVANHVADDLRSAEMGAASPLRAGLWAVSAARQPSSVIGSFGGFDAESRVSGFRRLHAVGGAIGSGPPAFRNRQLLALVAAGLVRFLGPAARVTIADGCFEASSPLVAGSGTRAMVLIDAWMHFHDVSATADPLIASLIAQGRIRPFRVRSRDGHPVATGAIDVDPATGRLIGDDGRLDSGIHVAGIPIEDAMHDSIISPMPGADATMLRETDRVARSALRIATGAVEAATRHRGVTDD